MRLMEAEQARRCKMRPLVMLWHSSSILLLFLLLCCLSCCARGELPATQAQALFSLQRLLEGPSALSGWSQTTSFCNLRPGTLLNVSCQSTGGGHTVTVLQIVGDKDSISVDQKLSANYNESRVRLSDAFSIQALASDLVKFPDLQVLKLVSLGIWGNIPPSLDRLRSLQTLNLSSNFLAGSVPDRYASLGSLQSLALDNNILTGGFPSALNVIPNLDTFDLSNNRLTGTIPTQVSLFTSLKMLSLVGNQFFGPIPSSISNLRNLVTLLLSDNLLAGEIPAAIAGMQSLLVVDLDGNQLGPSFPSLGSQLVVVKLSRNRLASQIPGVQAFGRNLQVLNLSVNSLVGTPPAGLFTLPSIRYLGLDHNRLSGNLPGNLTVSPNLTAVDISSNFFTGNVPDALNKTTTTTVRIQENCFNDQAMQQPVAYCLKALQQLPPSTAAPTGGSTAGASPEGAGKKKRWKGGVVAGIAGGTMALGAAATVLLLILIKFSRQGKLKEAANTMHCAQSSCADTASVGIPVDLLQSTRYLAHSGAAGAAPPPQCRMFTTWELEEATNGFSPSGIIGEGDYGKVFKGKLDDGTMVAVKRISIDTKQDMRQLKSHLEFLSRMRHTNLVSLLGYCLQRERDGQQSRRLYLVSEYIPNGTLRSHLFKRRMKESLSWSNRLVAVLGAARGLHYLHTGVVPGIFNNDVRITNILLDANFVAKLTDFGLARHDDAAAAALPLAASVASRSSDAQSDDLFTDESVTYIDLDHHHRKLATDKKDVYNFGLVLLEVVLGRQPTVIENPNTGKPKIEELEMMLTDSVYRSEMVDSAISGTCSEESLSTVLEIAAKCLSSDLTARPSMEDVLWNLQYAVQVQERRLSSSGDMQDELNGYHSKE